MEAMITQVNASNFVARLLLGQIRHRSKQFIHLNDATMDRLLKVNGEKRFTGDILLSKAKRDRAELQNVYLPALANDMIPTYPKIRRNHSAATANGTRRDAPQGGQACVRGHGGGHGRGSGGSDVGERIASGSGGGEKRARKEKCVDAAATHE